MPASGGPTRRTCVLRGLGALEAQVGALEELHDRARAPASARWAATRAWLRHHPAAEPWTFLVLDDDRLSAAAVLTRERSSVGWRIGKAVAPSEPYGLVALDGASAAELAGGISRQLRRFRRPWHLDLSRLPDPDPVVDSLRGFLTVAQVVHVRDTPQLDFRPGAPLSDYLSRNVRSAVAKARNRIAGDGLSTDLDWSADPGTIAALLPELVDVHRRRNEQLRGSWAYAGPGELAAFLDTVIAQARAGRARLLTVRIDGRLAAFALCLVCDGVLWVYSNYASPDWLHYSPGTIANAEVVLAAHAAPDIRRLDWGAGVQRYKLSGAVTLAGSQHLRAWSSRTARRTHAALVARRRYG